MLLALLLVLVVVVVATTPDPAPKQSTFDAYETVVHREGEAFSKASSDASASCGKSVESAECLAAIKTEEDAAATYRRALGRVTPPACLEAADAELRGALDLIVDADEKQIQGIAAQDADTINAGTALENAAVVKMNRSTALVKAAKC